MSVEENKEVVRRFFSEFANQRNFSAADELVSEDFVMHIASGVDLKGVEVAKKAYSALSNSFPDISYTIEDMVAEGDKVAFRVTIKGTHMQTFGNLAPTNKTFNISRFVIMKFNKNKFYEGWALDDNLSRYQQLGALSPTEEIGK